VLPRHRVLLVLTWLAWALQRLRLLPRRGPRALPPLSARSLARPLRSSSGAGDAVVLFTGCVMDAWMRDVHRCAVDVVEAAGAAVRFPGRGGDCCGALHVHAGRLDHARALARRVMASMVGDAPILVDSAGCGAAMQDYGRLLGTAEAEAFAARVVDIDTWLAGRTLPLRSGGGSVVVQDPCHLRNAQRAEGRVRDVLGAAYSIVETDDEGLCCGAGGAYAALQPGLSGAIRDRKVAAIAHVGGEGAVVASANPGCLLHLRAAGVDARHPVELLAAALARGERGTENTGKTENTGNTGGAHGA